MTISASKSNFNASSAQCLSSLRSKAATLGADTTVSGKLFQMLVGPNSIQEEMLFKPSFASCLQKLVPMTSCSPIAFQPYFQPRGCVCLVVCLFVSFFLFVRWNLCGRVPSPSESPLGG